MEELSNHQRAVELLQQLGLKEYESKCFVALSQLPKATAKEISELSDVPRTRVYDAVRVLEAKGLVEVQHSSPQQFRAVMTDEAAQTLRREFESRTETLVDVLGKLEPTNFDTDREITHEVWSLSGSTSIANRTHQLIGSAEQEVVLILNRRKILTDELLEHLRNALEMDLDVLVGTANDEVRETVEEALPDARVFVSGLEWLHSSPADAADDTTISRLLLVDKNTILVSSVHANQPEREAHEKAVFGRGFDNGIVVIARRLMATGLQPTDDPGLPGT
ncbi:TrmB family transcriptional regulator [Natronobiforma cellulositropha]|uniref:TrmB family transcriptional regulator n=1 Tax=Natronobiforma cellulositropha TaxID=1679076 RepID=UPI0021D56DE9|nr:helix-turn-helix domain-containing protein [Natronobiforma cellulositropha]